MMTKNVFLNDFFSKTAMIKYASAKKAIAISKEGPSELYPDFDFFIELLNSENQIIKWTAIQVIGNLSKVDKKKKVDKLLPRLIGFLNCGKMITANNTILALSEIALNKPKNQEMIFKEFIKVEHYNYDTLECRNVALGKVVSALGKFKDEIKDRKDILEFLERQTNNTRASVKKRAIKLLEKLKQYK
jgi:hypothetical protein